MTLHKIFAIYYWSNSSLGPFPPRKITVDLKLVSIIEQRKLLKMTLNEYMSDLIN